MNETWKNRQMIKFGFYGLLKNLKFFEPYLLLYLVSNQLSYTEIGVLYAIREAMVYVFEIPSGVFADRYGKKTELVIAFVFYIGSFVGFYIADTFMLFVIPMVLFGLGEAFRSGTHKAMIMSYIDHQAFEVEKRQVYGYTRSYSNVGSVISSLFSIVLILILPDLRILFMIAIIPYILDLLLIMSYPSYMNERIETKFSVKTFVIENYRSIRYAFQDSYRRQLLFSAAAFMAVIKTVKDYIQPLIFSIGITWIIFQAYSIDNHIKMYIGLTYAIAQFVSVFVTKNAYKLRKYWSSKIILISTWTLLGISIFLLGLFNEYIWVIVIMFSLLYVSLNIRKPYIVQKIGDATVSDKRASVLSIESQLTSIIIIILAPVLGAVADYWSISIMLLVLGGFIIIMGLFQLKQKSA